LEEHTALGQKALWFKRLWLLLALSKKKSLTC